MGPHSYKLSRRRIFALAAGIALSVRSQGQSPGKRGMIVRSARPLDLEMPLEGFSSALTPVEQFFVRTHVYMPAVDPANWRLTVDGNVRQPLVLGLGDLRRMLAAEVTAVLECAGNGRALFDPPVAGLQWRHGAAGNARWRGVRLADLLRRAGLQSGSVEALFDGADVPIGRMADFRRSIPIAKALHADTLLAYEMNGQPLPPEHGFPLRAVVPGWAGDSWTKWLTGVRVLTEPDNGYWMTSAYKHPGYPVAPGTLLPAAGLPPVTSLRVKSVIASPAPGASLRPGEPTVIRGTAWAGESGPVRRVDVSCDNGRTWAAARFLDPAARWGWRRWELPWTPPSERYVTIVARARDAKGEAQPSAQEWNPSGYLWNVVARVDVNVGNGSEASAPATAGGTPPPGFERSCLVCHQDDVIRQQRLTRAQWERELAKMTDWGAQVAPQDREALLDYLVRLSGRE